MGRAESSSRGELFTALSTRERDCRKTELQLGELDTMLFTRERA